MAARAFVIVKEVSYRSDRDKFGLYLELTKDTSYIALTGEK